MHLFSGVTTLVPPTLVPILFFMPGLSMLILISISFKRFPKKIWSCASNLPKIRLQMCSQNLLVHNVFLLLRDKLTVHDGQSRLRGRVKDKSVFCVLCFKDKDWYPFSFILSLFVIH